MKTKRKEKEKKKKRKEKKEEKKVMPGIELRTFDAGTRRKICEILLFIFMGSLFMRMTGSGKK